MRLVGHVRVISMPAFASLGRQKLQYKSFIRQKQENHSKCRVLIGYQSFKQ